MEDKKNELQVWLEEHKKQMIVAGIGIATVGVIVLGVRNSQIHNKVQFVLRKNTKMKDIEIATLIPGVEQLSILDTTIPFQEDDLKRKVFEVSQHVRTMTGGRKHSEEKAIEAASLGIILLPNQTLVDSYMKGVA